MINKLIVFIIIGIAVACQQVVTEDVLVEAKVPVTVAALAYGTVNDQLTFFANTLYMTRNVVTAPIPSFITHVYLKLGDHVREGQVIFALETKERRAIGNPTEGDSLLNSFGKIIVKAPASGIVSTLDKQQIGDYVLEGSTLCTIAESNALAFSVNVPFEFIAFAKTGTKCTLILPDNSSFTATFTTPLTTMNSLAQTQSILAKSDKSLFLPENLIVKVVVNRNTGASHQVLPRTSILSDEMLKEFWVMKLLNDTTAVKVPISLGNKNHISVEVLQPQFNPSDRFLTTGNYGLPDTARVAIVKN